MLPTIGQRQDQTALHGKTRNIVLQQPKLALVYSVGYGPFKISDRKFA